ncbi:MAG: hypothetical protein V2B18_11570 [Pseudomonadota bacterium]
MSPRRKSLSKKVLHKKRTSPDQEQPVKQEVSQAFRDEVRKRLADAVSAPSPEQALAGLTDLGMKLVGTFFNNAVDITAANEDWMDDRVEQYRKFERTLFCDDHLEKNKDGLHLGLCLASQELWLAHKEIEGANKLGTWDKDHLVDVPPNEYKVNLIRKYLSLPDAERSADTLEIMIEHEVKPLNKRSELTFNQIKSLMRASDVTLLQPEQFSRLVAVATRLDGAQKEEMVQLVKNLHAYVSKDLIGRINALYLMLGHPEMLTPAS